MGEGQEMAVITKLDLGGFSSGRRKQKNKKKKSRNDKNDATHPLKLPVGHRDGSCRVAVLLGKSDIGSRLYSYRSIFYSVPQSGVIREHV